MTIVLMMLLLVAKVDVTEKTPRDLTMMQGTWVAVSAELSGQPFPDEVRKTITLKIERDQYTVSVSGKDDRGTIKIDTSANPKAMDIVGTEGPNKGKTLYAIYEIKEDQLKVCYSLKGDGRPKEFSSPKGGLTFLVTYKR